MPRHKVLSPEDARFLMQAWTWALDWTVSCFQAVPDDSSSLLVQQVSVLCEHARIWGCAKEFVQAESAARSALDVAVAHYRPATATMWAAPFITCHSRLVAALTAQKVRLSFCASNSNGYMC